MEMPKMYQARDIDIPFGQLMPGKINYFKVGEMNTPKGLMDEGPPGKNDDAQQTACGIPDMAFANSKVAIHPYWLKYAGLDRYCQQDVCVSFWTDDHSDMIAKVTDICDPKVCKSPQDIQLPRSKVAVLRHKTSGWRTNPQFTGDADTEGIHWFFTKCIADGNVQAAYKKPASNWFSTPEYPNDWDNAIQIALKQQQNNQKSYPERGWNTYQNGLYPQAKDYKARSTPVRDWVPGQEPAWAPIAGGKGFANPTSKGEGTTGGETPEVNGTSGTGNEGSDNEANSNEDTAGSPPVAAKLAEPESAGNTTTTTTTTPQKAKPGSDDSSTVDTVADQGVGDGTEEDVCEL